MTYVKISSEFRHYFLLPDGKPRGLRKRDEERIIFENLLINSRLNVVKTLKNILTSQSIKIEEYYIPRSLSYQTQSIDDDTLFNGVQIT